MAMYDIAVIGGGPAGYVAAIKGAQLGGKVILFEKDAVGEELETLKDLTFATDNASCIITGDFDLKFAVFLFDSQISLESEIIEHSEQSAVELLLLACEFGIGFFRHLF